ncbi:MAG: exodeoxyribonuclease VII large subunit [Anaerolineaceae bacterium]|jgi:exodeoxyribonuclease VII large subunit
MAYFPDTLFSIMPMRIAYTLSMDSFDFFRPPVLTVTALGAYLRELLETDDILRDVWVRGEISNLNQYRSGHLYFTLKDAEAQVKCVMWKTSAYHLNFSPRDGQSVEIHGSMSYYANSGLAQLYVDSMQPVGEGLLYQEFLRLKNKLEVEGLFEEIHKRPLPRLPRHIGIITSASGAALHDMLNTLNRRLPLVRVTVAPSLVQGAEAPSSLCKALNLLNQIEDLELILLARGGGSIEDLWAFNDEKLAREVFNSRVPVISGVGHETDFTIADFVADLRAPTPTAAAELATPITINDLYAALQNTGVILQNSIEDAIATRSNQLDLMNIELRRLSPIQRVNNAIQTLDYLREKLDRTIQDQVNQLYFRLINLDYRLEALSPLAVLKRGFAIVNDAQTGQLISQASQAYENQPVQVRFADGEIPATLRPGSQEKL